jgi:anti-sigma regulatory factor (Ser/Thr protein kinase)
LGAIVGEAFLDVREQRRRHVRRIRLPNESRSVKVARDEVAVALYAMGWPDHAVDRARVVASELVTNALLHAGTGFELTVRVEGAAWIEVSDGAPAALPQRADPADARPGGMGLYLVDALAEEWGVERDPTCKIVWARLTPEEL